MSLKGKYNGGLTCAMNVTDISSSIQWFTEILGFELLYHLEEMGWCELKSPVEGVNVGLSQVEKMPPPGGNAVLTWGVQDIDATYSFLSSKDVKFDGEVRTIPGMVKLATFFDPDDNCFMLYQDIEQKD